MGVVPPSHPRYASLMGRKLLTEAAAAGMLAESALIAHGRGEAFDYLLGEATCEAARLAIAESAARLAAADRPVISLNGNATALAADTLLACAAVLDCPVEINIYYRTPARMEALLGHLRARQAALAESPAPSGWTDAHGDWAAKIAAVPILGDAPDARIPDLDGPRANCHADGILASDCILVPLEDGDRCEALVAMGKTLCVIDLNPMSRTAKTATVTIVDELMRCAGLLLDELLRGSAEVDTDFCNIENLDSALSVMLSALNR